MKVSQLQKSGKFSISNITESELIDLYHQSDNSLKSKIGKVLIESKSEEECKEEFDCTPQEFWANVGIEV